MKISVFILEKESHISDALVHWLEDDASIGITTVCHTTADAMTHISQHESDVYVIDIGVTEWSGVDVISTVNTRYPNAKILAHSAYSNHRLIWSAIGAGANGYILRDDVSKSVGDSIVCLVNGGGFVSSQAAKVLIDGVRQGDVATAPPTPKPPLDRGLGHEIGAPIGAVGFERQLLTPKELQVLSYIQQGYPAKRVAGVLDISIFTVNQHIRSIYRKLNVRNKMEAVQAARAAGLL